MAIANNYKANLDKIQTSIFQYLKPLGFKKKGRNFNRETENGIVQVINLQSGQYPIGEYVIPGIRESYYGKFTVNMGVLVEEIHNLNFPSKPFYGEYYCQIRTRLPELSRGRDYWWDLSENPEQIAKEIIKELSWAGFTWFNFFKTRDLICQNWGNNNVVSSARRAKLDVAIIELQRNRERGEELFQEYYNKIENHKGHKEYVKTLGLRLGIAL